MKEILRPQFSGAVQSEAAETMSGESVLVAVIDSGWQRSRNDPRVLPGVGMVSTENDLELAISSDDKDRHGHGTVCAGIVLGIAPRAWILPIRVFGRRLETSISQVVEALWAAAERRADVVNLSLATIRDDVIIELHAACENATRAGAIVVAAAMPGVRYSFPAAFDNVIGVKGTNDLESLSVRYRRKEAVEFEACGLPADGLAGRGQASSSLAAARVTGLMAIFRHEQPLGTVEDGRAWLVARRVRTRFSQ